MGPINNVSALVQIMFGAEQPTSHYRNQCSLAHVYVTRPWCVNMIREYDGNIDTKIPQVDISTVPSCKLLSKLWK